MEVNLTQEELEVLIEWHKREADTPAFSYSGGQDSLYHRQRAYELERVPERSRR